MAQTLYTPLVTLIRSEWLNDVDAATYNTLSSVSGTNTIVGTGPTTVTAYAANQRFFFTPAATNTGATTLNVSSIGAKNIFSDGAACVGGELKIAVPVLVFYDGTQFNLIGRRFFKQPTSQIFTSGSGTYTTPAGATRIEVELIGGGGGGGGTAADGSPAGGAGGNTTFSTLTGNGGAGGSAAGGGAVAGGTATGGDINLTGGGGASGANAGAGISDGFGAHGGYGFFGGSGAAVGTNQAGASGAANTGGGGSGHGANAELAGGGGGGAGGYCRKRITAPAATYSYGVGAAGSAATSAGAGGSGIIIVDEFYN